MQGRSDADFLSIQSGSKLSFSIALICTSSFPIPASTSRNEGPEKGDLMQGRSDADFLSMLLAFAEHALPPALQGTTPPHSGLRMFWARSISGRACSNVHYAGP